MKVSNLKKTMLCLVLGSLNLYADFIPAPVALSVENLPAGSKLVLKQDVTLEGASSNTSYGTQIASQALPQLSGQFSTTVYNPILPPRNLNRYRIENVYAFTRSSCTYHHDSVLYERTVPMGTELVVSSVKEVALATGRGHQFEIVPSPDQPIKRVTCGLRFYLEFDLWYTARVNGGIPETYSHESIGSAQQEGQTLSSIETLACHFHTLVSAPQGASNPEPVCSSKVAFPASYTARNLIVK